MDFKGNPVYEINHLPPELRAVVQNAVANLEYDNNDASPEHQSETQNVSYDALPLKSIKKYELTYDNFKEWQKEKGCANVFTENVLIAYFKEISKTLKPSSVWSRYSMIKSTLKINKQLDIGKYRKLSTFLRENASGFTSRKAKILTADEVNTFLDNAPDRQYLATKVVMLFGITGACRTMELVNLTIDDIEVQGRILFVKIINATTNVPRSFIIEGKFRDIVEKYRALRPDNTPTNRFFLHYRKGRCTRQVIGKNQFCEMPKQIAEFLNLSDPKSYTPHSFRKTAASLFASSGANVVAVGEHEKCKKSVRAYSRKSKEVEEQNNSTFDFEVVQCGTDFENDFDDAASSTDYLDIIPENSFEAEQDQLSLDVNGTKNTSKSDYSPIVLNDDEDDDIDDDNDDDPDFRNNVIIIKEQHDDKANDNEVDTLTENSDKRPNINKSTVRKGIKRPAEEKFSTVNEFLSSLRKGLRRLPPERRIELEIEYLDRLYEVQDSLGIFDD